MKLTPRELDSLLLSQAGFVAQRRLARGCRLSHPEAVALIACQVQELARDGSSVAELMSKGRTLLGRRQLQEGVPDMIPEVQVEATFPDGTKLVTVSRPICREHGDLGLALHGSFLPLPDADLFRDDATSLQDRGVVERSPPGSVFPCPDSPPIALNAGRRRVALTVASTCDRPIQVGSHYHFTEANKSLVFDRALAYGMRLDIPSGSAVRFEPGDVKEVTLVEIAGKRVVSGGNGLCSGPVREDNLPGLVDRVRRRGFGNARQGERLEPVPCLVPRYLYAKNYGPTLGDKVRLGDTCLLIEVEKDFCVYGDECKFGGGKVLREGMGQANLVTRAEALDTLITNCLIVDAVLGVVKADLGIKGNRICGIGKAGNPDVMAGVDPSLVVAACTEVIAGEGLLLTAGGVDCHVHLVCPQLVEGALASGVTTLLGGGTGPATGTNATTCSPGPFHIRSMMESTDAFPVNFGLTGKGNSSDLGELSAALEEQVVAGAIGLKLHEDWGSTPAAIDACLRVADEHDVQVTIHTDTLNESSCVEDTVAAFAGRTVHAYHAEGAGGGHAPDIIRVCGEGNVLPSSTTPTRPFTRNTVDEHLDMLLQCHHLDRNLKEDLSFAESRIRGETIAAEDVLHDMGAIGIISSDSQAMGRIGEVVSRTWQTADKMKRARGPLPEDGPRSDNARVRRYLAKYTANPAIAHGIAHLVGSVQVGKMADLVLWNPAFFGAKPKMVIKGGQIVWSEMGLANASIPSAQPVLHRKMFGAYGRSPAKNSCLFVSKASLAQRVVQGYDVQKELVAVEGCRNISKKDLLWNDALPKLRVDPETYKVYAAERINGEEVWNHLTCDPASRVALASKYFLF